MTLEGGKEGRCDGINRASKQITNNPLVHVVFSFQGRDVDVLQNTILPPAKSRQWIVLNHDGHDKIYRRERKTPSSYAATRDMVTTGAGREDCECVGGVDVLSAITTNMRLIKVIRGIGSGMTGGQLRHEMKGESKLLFI